jgi:formylglycine-generating enzyme required for sulfatase activity
VPLGPDPDSGLFEFAHLGSGSVPARDPETKRLVYEDDAAIVLVLILGGALRMGAQKEDPDAPNHDPEANDDESPVDEVTLSPYFLAKHAVTQAQWKAPTEGLDPITYEAGPTWGEKPQTPRNPVEQVSWEDCDRWRSRNRLVLPTEAPWAYACRAGTDTPWIMGLDVAALGEVANLADEYCKEHGGHPSWAYTEDVGDGHTVHAPVGSFAANAFGLHDMHGDVWELCQAVYAGGAYALRPTTDPLAQQGSGFRVCRVGAWRDVAMYARSAYRHRSAPGNRRHDLGVRPARPVEP